MGFFWTNSATWVFTGNTRFTLCVLRWLRLLPPGRDDPTAEVEGSQVRARKCSRNRSKEEIKKEIIFDFPLPVFELTMVFNKLNTKLWKPIKYDLASNLIVKNKIWVSLLTQQGYSSLKNWHLVLLFIWVNKVTRKSDLPLKIFN